VGAGAVEVAEVDEAGRAMSRSLIIWSAVRRRSEERRGASGLIWMFFVRRGYIFLIY